MWGLFPLRGQKNFKRRPQNRILVPLRGSFQNFRRAPPRLFLQRSSPRAGVGGCTGNVLSKGIIHPFNGIDFYPKRSKLATLLQPEKLLFGSLRNIRPGAIFSMTEVLFKDSRGVGGVLGTASPRSVTRYSCEVENEDKPKVCFQIPRVLVTENVVGSWAHSVRRIGHCNRYLRVS